MPFKDKVFEEKTQVNQTIAYKLTTTGVIRRNDAENASYDVIIYLFGSKIASYKATTGDYKALPYDMKAKSVNICPPVAMADTVLAPILSETFSSS